MNLVNTYNRGAVYMYNMQSIKKENFSRILWDKEGLDVWIG